MKVAIFAVFLFAVVAVNAAPSKRLLDFPNLHLGGGCAFQVMCFINPCMIASCASNPEAKCRQGCACSAEWTDATGNKVMC